MGKRKLSQRQQHRIADRQSQRLQRSRGAPEVTSEQALGAETPGLVICHYGQQLEVESTGADDSGRRYRCHQRANLPPLVSGDRIVWQPAGPDTGVVVALASRRNVFCRPGFGGVLKPVASNIDRVLIVLAPVPQPYMNLLDRYLVAVHVLGLRPLLVLNKSDLLRTSDPEIDSMLSLYQDIGYEVRRVSSSSGQGIAALRAELQGQTAVVVGQSGVGKSSLINALGPDIAAQVGALSEAMAKGTHTTTAARLFHGVGFDLIDSPGIREFNLWDIDPQQLQSGFPEFQPFLDRCRFRDCRHEEEPGCALRQAVSAGLVSPARMSSFQQLRRSLPDAPPAQTR